MLKRIINTIWQRDLDLNDRIFRMIILIGGVLALGGFVECLLLMDVRMILIPITILLAVFGFSLIATFKYRRTDIVAVLLGILMLVVVFPEMFLLSGGLEGGATVWFVLGIFYVFLMFDGVKLKLFLALALVMDCLTYGYGYHFPERIVPMDSRAAAFLDSFFAVVVIGLAGGIILKLQSRFFEQERKVTLKQKNKLEKISDANSNFFASMSHEIRTPINTIVGLNEMILRESREENTKEYAQKIQSASRMLLSLVNDILDLSQMEMKKMEIVPIEYETSELFYELIDMIRVRLEEKKLELFVDIDENIPSVLYGDMKRFQQVLLNILTNAAKYTQEGSVTLTVQMEQAEEDEILLRVSVEDTGIGIRKEDLEHLYDSFRRVDAEKNRKIEGSGLGLSITKQLLDLMGGEISVDSIYTKGSTFTVTVPQKVVRNTPMGDIRLYSRKGAQEGMHYQRSFEAPEARILIVDDNAMNSMVVCKLLEGTKVQVDVAQNGEECLEKTGRKYYHVILLDYLMPEMNGAETLREIRRQENGLCKDSVVIVLTANTTTEANRLFQKNAFDSYLEKPIQGAVLEAEILKFLPEDIVEYRRDTSEADNTLEIQKITRTKKRRILVTTDCVSELPEELREKYNIGLMYLYIKTDRGRFMDTREIDSEDLTEYLSDPEAKVRSDSVSVADYESFFADVLTQAEEIVHVSMASGAGKSYGIAVEAAACFDHVHVVDSTKISCGQGLVVLYAAKLAGEGCTVAQVCSELEKMKHQVATFFLMPSVDKYYGNGYTNVYAAKICALLHLRPELRMKKSRLCIAWTRFGNMEKAYKRFIRFHLLRKSRINTDVIYITHAGLNVRQQELIRREVLRCVPFEKIIIQKASVSTSCISGIGAIGIAYYLNRRD